MFVRVKTVGKYEYRQLVENHRQGRRVVQKVLCSLGRLDKGDPDAMTYPHECPGQTALSPSAQREKRAVILGNSSLMHDLGFEHLLEISRFTKERRLSAQEFLFSQGDLVESFYIIARGRVKVLNHSMSGRDFIIAFCGPWEVLGNTLAFSGKPHPSSVVAVTNTAVLEVNVTDFESFLARHASIAPKILRRLLVVTTDRLLDAVLRLNMMATERTDRRIANVLALLSSRFGTTIPSTKCEIAEMAGTTTETTIRFMANLSRVGVLKSFRGKVIVLDQVQLQRLADGIVS